MKNNTVQDNEFFDFVCSIPLLSREEEKELIKQAHNHDAKAKEKLVMHNLRFVLQSANKYTGYGLTLQELFQEGTIGLIKAISNFDEEKNVKFITYAAFWVKREMIFALKSQSQTIRISFRTFEDLIELKCTISSLANKLSREPTNEELAETLRVTLTKVQKLKKYLNPILSLDSQEIDSKKLAAQGCSVEEYACKQDFKYQIVNFLNKSRLTQQEKEVLTLFYGLNNNVCYSLSQLAQKYCVSKEQVHEIKKKALKKLRSTSKIKEFLCYLDDPITAREKLETHQVNIIQNPNYYKRSLNKKKYN